VITGITGTRNRGVEALLSTAVAGLRRLWPECGIDVLTYDCEFDSRGGIPVRFHPNPYRVASPGRLAALAESLRPRRLRELRAAARVISGASAVIASGGDVFSSDYGALSRHLAPLSVAQRRGVPVFFLGHSIGRFLTAHDAESWLRCARRSVGVTVRESSSHQYVVETLGLREVAVRQAADTAFLLEPASPERGRDLARRCGLDEARPAVACSVSQGIVCYSPQDSEEHARAWTRLVEHIAADGQRQVLVVPHVQEREEHNDDRVLAARLVRSLRHLPSVLAAPDEASAADYKRLISGCAFGVAERMHAAIAGFSSCVPTLTVGYSIKAEGIVRDAYGDAHGVLVPLPRFVAPGQAAALFDRAWTRRDELAGRLAARLPGSIQGALANFEVLRELMPDPALRRG
jgi:colanic acid/amylovoran biosynthesis protein